MDNLQAKQMLKQVDCHGIPRGYNGGYSELNKYCLESIDKLEKIEQIVNSEVDPNICNNVGYVRKVQAIKKILEQE